MRLYIICFTPQGYTLCRQVMAALPKEIQARGYALGRFLPCSGPEVKKVETSLSQWAKAAFQEADAILFIGACGIAVRAIAPYLKGKAVDPAVAVMDHRGQYVVSLLSGHIGGANNLTQLIAQISGAVPVISTATDVDNTFSVDSFAVANKLNIFEIPKVKLVSSAVLRGEPVGFCSHFPIAGQQPEALGAQGKTGFCITLSGEETPFAETLHLVPQLALGIGCRRGITCGQIEQAVKLAFSTYHIALAAAAGVYSINLKKDEPGLLEFCEKYRLPARFFTPQELQSAAPPQGQQFSSSAFVANVTGVDNVCERAAILGSGGGKLYIPKQACSGVTVAAAGNIALSWDNK